MTVYKRFLALLSGKRISAHVSDARTVFVPELHKACIILNWPDGVNLKHIDKVECIDGQITIVATTLPPVHETVLSNNTRPQYYQ